jgi:hypothetical protein
MIITVDCLFLANTIKMQNVVLCFPYYSANNTFKICIYLIKKTCRCIEFQICAIIETITFKV